MVATPGSLILSFLLGLLALSGFLAAMFLLRRAFVTPKLAEVRTSGVVVRPALTPKAAQSRRRLLIFLGIGLGFLVFGGHTLVSLLHASDGDAPRDEFGPITRRVNGPSGAELAVQESGAEGAPRLVFTHGWGADRREWDYARRRLENRYRVVTWDLPGLGQSGPVPNGDYSLPKLAADLSAVVDSTGAQPAVLVGHSIGGMINLTLCQIGGGSPGSNVAGIVQLNTSYTNPVKTVKGHETQEKLQKPVYEPLLHVIAATSPVMRGLGWLRLPVRVGASAVEIELRGHRDLGTT